MTVGVIDGSIGDGTTVRVIDGLEVRLVAQLWE